MIIYVISVLFLLCFRAPLFTDALWSPSGKTNILSLVCDSRNTALLFTLINSTVKVRFVKTRAKKERKAQVYDTGEIVSLY